MTTKQTSPVPREGYDEARRELEIAVMLTVNDRLYKQGRISAEMYHRAKELIYSA